VQFLKCPFVYYEIYSYLDVIIISTTPSLQHRLLVEMNKCMCRGIVGKQILIRVEFNDFCLYLGPNFFVDFCL
jgi:hypothetical protein